MNIKSISLSTLFLAISISAYCQGFSKQDFLGRWSSYQNKKIINDRDIIIHSDSTLTFTFTNGLFLYNNKYKAEFEKDIIRLTLSPDPNPKKYSGYKLIAKVLNDSTLILRNGKSSKKLDKASDKNVVFHKVKLNNPSNEFHLPTYRDLVGDWSNIFKGKTYATWTFIDHERLKMQDSNGKIEEITYKVDFRKKPATIDFYLPDRPKPLAGFIALRQKSFFLELFHKDNRGDRFHTFGSNSVFTRTSK